MASTSKRSRPVSGSPPAETLSKEERRAHKKAKKAELAALEHAASDDDDEPEVAEKEHKKKRKAAVDESAAEEEEPVKETKEERKRRKEERKVAALLGVPVAEEPSRKKHKAASTDPAEIARKAAKKERKRLAAQAAVNSEEEDAMDEDEEDVEEERKRRKAEKKARKLAVKLLAAAAEEAVAAPAVVKKRADKGKGKEVALDASLAEASMDDILAALQKPSRSSTLGAALKAHGASIPESKEAGSKVAPSKAKGAKKVVETEAAIDFSSLGAKDILSSQWLPLKRIKELAEEHNFEYKKGKFSTSEDALIRQTLTNYASTHGLSPEELDLVIFTKGRTSRSSLPASSQFWPTIASALEGRPVLAVYNHVRRLYAPTHAMGAWSAQEDADLVRGVREHGTAWEKIGEEVGRSAGDCRDRWRNHVGFKKAAEGEEGVRKGKWDTEETEMLVKAVEKEGQNWTTVAKIVGTRSRHQCRIKWNDDVKRKLATAAAVEAGSAPLIWNTEYRPNLIIAVSNFAAADTTEIDWKQITDPFLAPHGPANLRKYWVRLAKKAVSAGVEGGHAAQVEWLLVKYPAGEAPKNIPRKALRKLTKKGKAVAVSSSEDEDELESEEEAPVAKKGRGRPRRETVKAVESKKSAQFVSDSDDE